MSTSQNIIKNMAASISSNSSSINKILTQKKPVAINNWLYQTSNSASVGLDSLFN